MNIRVDEVAELIKADWLNHYCQSVKESASRILSSIQEFQEKKWLPNNPIALKDIRQTDIVLILRRGAVLAAPAEFIGNGDQWARLEIPAIPVEVDSDQVKELKELFDNPASCGDDVIDIVKKYEQKALSK